MALETERCSPNNASSPGPTSNRRPGSEGGSSAGYTQPNPVQESKSEESAIDTKPQKPRSAFHQIALLTQCSTEAQDKTSHSTDIQSFQETSSFPSEFSDSRRPEDTSRGQESQSPQSVDSSNCAPEEGPRFLPDRTQFISHFPEQNKIPNRPLSNESSSNLSHRSPSGNPPYSTESSPPTSPILSSSPDRRNGFSSDTRIPGAFQPEVPQFSFVYGLGVIPRFPINLHLPTVYPDIDRSFGSLPRLPTVIASKPQESPALFAARNSNECQSPVEKRLFNPIKNSVSQKSSKECQRIALMSPRYPEMGYKPSSSLSTAQAPRCNCCCSPSPRVAASRSPSPNRQHPPAPSSSLTFSVDNILRPEFGRSAVITRHGSHKSPPATIPQHTPRLEKLSMKKSDVDTSSRSPQKPATPIAEKASDATLPDDKDPNGQVWPAWVYCTRYSDRPSSGKKSLHV